MAGEPMSDNDGFPTMEVACSWSLSHCVGECRGLAGRQGFELAKSPRRLKPCQRSTMLCLRGAGQVDNTSTPSGASGSSGSSGSARGLAAERSLGWLPA